MDLPPYVFLFSVWLFAGAPNLFGRAVTIAGASFPLFAAGADVSEISGGHLSAATMSREHANGMAKRIVHCAMAMMPAKA
jgi:hypothetical protein